MTAMTIKGLAGRGGVGVETIRYYQRRGLLDRPDRGGGARPGGGIRRYDEDHVRRLHFIRAAQAAGFTLDQVGELLSLDATDDRDRVRRLAVDRLADLDARIATLQQARAALGRLARTCGEGAAGPCPIIAAFEGPPVG